MKYNKGFTLIELIAVIALIALLSLVIIPSIIGLVNKNKPKLDSVTKELIYSATGAYLDANQTKYIKSKGAVYCVKLETLVDNGFLEENLINISSGENYDLNLIVKSDYNGYKYNYEILNSSNNCTEKYPDTTNPYISIGTLKYTKYDGVEKAKMYSNVEYTMEVPVITNKVNDGETLSLKIRRGSGYADYFTVTGGAVNSNTTSFQVQVPKTAKIGEYVIEVTDTSGKIDKATKNFKVYVNPIILFMGD